MYITCIILCLFSALSRRVGALQISIIIINHESDYCFRLNPSPLVFSCLATKLDEDCRDRPKHTVCCSLFFSILLLFRTVANRTKRMTVKLKFSQTSMSTMLSQPTQVTETEMQRDLLRQRCDRFTNH